MRTPTQVQLQWPSYIWWMVSISFNLSQEIIDLEKESTMQLARMFERISKICKLHRLCIVSTNPGFYASIDVLYADVSENVEHWCEIFGAFGIFGATIADIFVQMKLLISPLSCAVMKFPMGDEVLQSGNTVNCII